MVHTMTHCQFKLGVALVVAVLALGPITIAAATTVPSTVGSGAFGPIISKLKAGENATYVATYHGSMFSLQYASRLPSNFALAYVAHHISWRYIDNGNSQYSCDNASGSWFCLTGNALSAIGGINSNVDLFQSRYWYGILSDLRTGVHEKTSTMTVAGFPLQCATWSGNRSSVASGEVCVTSHGVIGYVSSNYYEPDCCKLQSLLTSVSPSVLQLPARAPVFSSRPPTATEPPNTPASALGSLVGKTVAQGWPPLTKQFPVAKAVAIAGARYGAFGVEFLAFPDATSAAVFGSNPPTKIGSLVSPPPGDIYAYASQEAFANQALNQNASVYNFRHGVSIFLRHGNDVLIGTYYGEPPASGDLFNLDAIGLSQVVQSAYTLLVPPSIPKTTLGSGGFAALKNKSLPGPAPSNWPALQELGDVPPAALAADEATSNDIKQTVTFYDFSTVMQASAFYKNPPGGMQSFIGGALAYAPLGGSTGAPAPSRGADMRSCGGSDVLTKSGACSTGGGTFSIGVATIIQRGKVVILVGWLSNNRPLHATGAELNQNNALSLSAVKLLAEVGIT